MKSLRLNLIFCTLLFTVLFLIGCKKETTETNYFSVVDSYSNIPQKFGLKYCSIMNNGITSKNTYEYYLMVSSSSIFIADILNWPDSDGKYVMIKLYSKDETLPTGQYTYDPFSSKDENTVNYCNANYSGSMIFYSGIINIVHNGNRITLDFEFYNTITNPEISMKLDGYYTGTVEELILPPK